MAATFHSLVFISGFSAAACLHHVPCTTSREYLVLDLWEIWTFYWNTVLEKKCRTCFIQGEEDGEHGNLSSGTYIHTSFIIPQKERKPYHVLNFVPRQFLLLVFLSLKFVLLLVERSLETTCESVETTTHICIRLDCLRHTYASSDSVCTRNNLYTELPFNFYSYYYMFSLRRDSSCHSFLFLLKERMLLNVDTGWPFLSVFMTN